MPIINTIIQGGGSAPVIDPLSVTPSTSSQTITASGGVNGYSPINVSAVDSSIDANITAGNIKDGVTILGVQGTYTGTQPTGTKPITTNGTHDVSGYAFADVQVPTAGPDYYIAKSKDANNKLVNGSTVIDLTGIVDIGNYALRYAYFGNTNITGTMTSLSTLTTISGTNACQNMFYQCSGITSIDLGCLTTLSGNNSCQEMFYSCSGITSIDLSSLTTISGNFSCSSMFNSCSRLTNVSLSSLTSVTGNACCAAMFSFCTSLTTLSFPALKNFGSSLNQFNNMLNGVSGCTVHFPSNTQSKIETLASYPNFAGTNTVIAFDLPATNTLTGADTIEYTRNPKYDTATALAWKVGAYGTTNFNPAYYTSGTTDPAVSDTIYSDSACTTAVTTITSIA